MTSHSPASKATPPPTPPAPAPPGVPLDLSNRTQIHHLVVSFYRELSMDEVLGPIFNEVAEVDWGKHIPTLIDFWCRVLLGDPTYQGAILTVHRHIHDQLPFTADHFDRWYTMFVATIDEHWAGPYAETAKSHAAKIASSLARQLPKLAWEPPLGTPGAVPFEVPAEDGNGPIIQPIALTVMAKRSDSQ